VLLARFAFQACSFNPRQSISSARPFLLTADPFRETESSGRSGRAAGGPA
jgi:hypothetical protein